MKIKRTVLFSALICAMLMISALPAFASGTKNYTLGTWQAAKTDTYYKFKATETGFVSVFLNSSTIGMTGAIYDSSKTASNSFFYVKNPSNSALYKDGFRNLCGRRFAVQKGKTFYFCASSIYGTGAKFKLIQTKYSAGSNASMAKARSLAANHAVYAVTTPGYSFGKWYKIVTTAAQKIRICGVADAANCGSIRICNNRGKNLPITVSASDEVLRVTTNSKAAAGTYYIYLRAAAFDSENAYQLAHFYWK